MSLQFRKSRRAKILFRVREKIVLRIKETKAIATRESPERRDLVSLSDSGPSAGSSPASPDPVTIGVSIGPFATEAGFGGSASSDLEVDQEGLSLVVRGGGVIPRSRRMDRPTRSDHGAARHGRADGEFTYVDVRPRRASVPAVPEGRRARAYCDEPSHARETKDMWLGEACLLGLSSWAAVSPA